MTERFEMHMRLVLAQRRISMERIHKYEDMPAIATANALIATARMWNLSIDDICKIFRMKPAKVLKILGERMKYDILVDGEKTSDVACDKFMNKTEVDSFRLAYAKRHKIGVDGIELRRNDTWQNS